ncbi:MAG: L,D-transpeptidase [Propionibacteriaceae bacterium]|jgi:hypothetical protein|nr:L,D-transpeptidase [Propionibacteriaceae bacterium]
MSGGQSGGRSATAPARRVAPGAGETPATIAAAQRAARPRRPGKAALVFALTLAVVLGAVAYTSFALSAYGSTVKPGVTVGALSVAGYNTQELTAVVNRLADEAEVTVVYEDAVQTVRLAELGAVVDVAATVKAVFSADTGPSLIADYTGWSKQAVPLSLTADEAALAGWVGRHFETGQPAPADAAVRFDEATGRYIVAPGQTGHVFDLASIREALDEIAWTPQSNPVAILRLVEREPDVGDVAALAAAEQANSRLALTLRFANGAGGSYTATPADIAAWTAVVPDPAVGDVAVFCDQAVLSAGLRERLETAWAGRGKPRHIVADANGQILQVADNGQASLAVGDLASTVEAVATALDNGLDVDLTVPVSETPPATIESQLSGPAPTGGKWIDVDLSSQTTTLLEGSHVVASYIISSGKEGTPTPTGVYYVYLKVPAQTMNGTEADGSPYSIPNVTWVTYFWEDYGFHTAYWLDDSQIGTPQSHGCLNMREAESRFLYEWSSNGTPVVVHD